jgi:hypothetical protein
MSASIRVESGISAGTKYWIDRPVLRIGSDPQCDVCLPSAELAPHALTLEFRDGTYRAYNRGAAPVTIGREMVNSGSVGVWPADATVALPGDVRLVLEIDGDPQPAPRPESRFDDVLVEGAESPEAEAAVATGDAAGTKKSSSTTQMAIIGLCVLMMGALLMFNRAGSTTTVADRPTFDAIVRSSLEGDDTVRTVVRRLQYAQAALVRGNFDQARERFSKLRDQLLVPNDSLSADDRTEIDKVRSYVEYRLGQL